jgi:hypothetical protein
MLWSRDGGYVRASRRPRPRLGRSLWQHNKPPSKGRPRRGLIGVPKADRRPGDQLDGNGHVDPTDTFRPLTSSSPKAIAANICAGNAVTPSAYKHEGKQHVPMVATELKSLMVSGLAGNVGAHRSLLEKLSRRLRGYYADSRSHCSLANAAGELASCVSAMTAPLSGLAILEIGGDAPTRSRSLSGSSARPIRASRHASQSVKARIASVRAIASAPIGANVRASGASPESNGLLSIA